MPSILPLYLPKSMTLSVAGIVFGLFVIMGILWRLNEHERVENVEEED